MLIAEFYERSIAVLVTESVLPLSTMREWLI